MRNGKKTGAAALLLCGVMAASSVGMGFAKWQTTVTAGGNVSAAGKWDVEMTNASVTLSSGAQLRENDADYGLQNVCAQKVYGRPASRRPYRARSSHPSRPPARRTAASP